MSFRRDGVEIAKRREAVEDAQIALDRATKRLEPLKEFSARVDAAGEAFIAELKSAGEDLPESVGREILDEELRRIRGVVAAVEVAVCEMGDKSHLEIERKVLDPLEKAVEAAEDALMAALSMEEGAAYRRGDG